MARGFGSDNHSGVHPKILSALGAVNSGHAPSYGTDAWTEECEKQFKHVFGSQAETFFVFNGTAANVLSLRALTRPYQAVLCTDVSHINVDECGAPEFFTGCKLWVLPSKNGKIQLEDLKKAVIRKGDQHFAQMKVLSLTQPTELGTVYSLQEMQAITQWAKENRIRVHVDGSRLANACVHLNKSFKEITTDLGVDIVSMGGTKNGLMMGEAVVILNKEVLQDFVYIRKQSAQLPSKTRFISTQFLAYFDGGLWREIASHSTKMAQLLYQAVKDIPHVTVTQPVESNAVFAMIPKAWVGPLKKHTFFYVWDENTFECRWMMSWDTQPEDIESFAAALKELSHEIPSPSLS